MIIVAALSLATFSAAVQKTIDLNGTWVLDPSRSDSGRMRQGNRIGDFPGGGGLGLPGGVGFPGGSYPGIGYPGNRRGGGYPGGGDDGDGGEGMPRAQMQNLTLQIVQTDKEVQTTRKFAIDGEERTISQTFALDGSQSNNPASNGRGEFVSKSTLKKDKFVNLGTQIMKRGERSFDVTVEEEYSLSRDGKTLTIKTKRITQRGNLSTKQVFNKQEASSAVFFPSKQ
jgi:hypothetical protein